jgi:TIR domain
MSGCYERQPLNCQHGTMIRDDAPFEYDVALSFAGENREVVEGIASCLRGRGVKVFYDDFERTSLWGKDLQERFVNIYMRWARYAVVFVSAPYREKMWTRQELKAVLARALSEGQEYVLPVRLDDTSLDGLLPTIGYLDLQHETPAGVCIRICQKVGIGVSGRKADQVSPPWSPHERGTVTFDYSNYNGRYRIGKEPYLFETAWSKGSDVSIHCYNDPPSIRGVAVAPIGTSVSQVSDAKALDYSSRTRTAREGQVVVLENTNEFFAALRIVDVKDDTRSDARDELSFEYWILRDGGKDFSAVLSPRLTPI